MRDLPSRKLTDADLRLMRLLQEDGRRSNSDLARELDVSESTVRRRIDWLVEEDIIRCTASCNPFRIGYSVFTLVQLQVDLMSIEHIADSLAELPEVTYVAVTSGAYDILFTAVFESNESLYDFMTRKLATYEGIRSTASSAILRVTKRSFVVADPEVVEPAPVGRPMMPRKRGHNGSGRKREAQ